MAAGGHLGLGGPISSDPLIVEAGRLARELLGRSPTNGRVYMIDPAKRWVSGPQPYEHGGSGPFWLDGAEPNPGFLRAAEISLAGVSDDLIATLADNPQLLHSLHWRSFEELIAELLTRSGFEVELTSGSRDHGVDIYAVSHGVFGRMLYVVECKRYSPHRGVSPGLIRQLYGVIERERATQGLLATTSFFTKGAVAEQRNIQFRVSLCDFDALHDWLCEVRDGQGTRHPCSRKGGARLSSERSSRRLPLR
ncbi:MAG: restriction endonuclease [Solirubrobacteraceae bacterium]